MSDLSEQFSRTQMILGSDAISRLQKSRVIIFGVGGVGGFVCEALARAGVGALDIVDNDTVAPSNINRQIIALHSTLGQPKVKIMNERIHDINPDCSVTAHQLFFLPETASHFNFGSYDYVVDAVDTVAAKIAIIESAKNCGTPVISSMGAGNKLDPTQFKIADIAHTSVCPLARAVRHELKKRNITNIKVVYSTEKPIAPLSQDANSFASGSTFASGASSADESSFAGGATSSANASGSPSVRVPGSISFVPPVAGLLIASEVVKDLIGNAGISENRKQQETDR